MSEREKIIPPEEMQKAEQMMTPVEKAMSRVRSEIITLQDAFLAVGITEQEIEKAADKACELVKEEFERKEKEDIFCRIGEILKKTAQTEEEMFFAEYFTEGLEDSRLRWADKIRDRKQKAKNRGDVFDINKELKYMDVHNLAPTSTSERSGECYAGFSIMRPQSARSRVFKPSKEFLERILKKLDALDEGDSFEGLKSFPSKREDDGPVYRYDPNYSVTRWLPTNIQGLKLNIYFDEPGIEAFVNSSNLERIVEFPKR